MMNDETDNIYDDDEDLGGEIPEFPRPGAMLDRGRIVIERHLRGRLWAGRADRHAVLITHKV